VQIAYGRTFEVGEGEAGLDAARRMAEAELSNIVREVRWDDGATAIG
jgi:ribulose 1,5-bisphosphate synthetase/thiazole synthase